MRTHTVWLVLLLTGCPWVSGLKLEELRDMDEDGYVDEAFGGSDCNDADSSVYPGAPDEWYDGLLKDCDRLDDFDQDGDGLGVEEDCDDSDLAVLGEVTYYLDEDGDGFGTPEVSQQFCAGLEELGWVDNDLDCDDGEPEESPASMWYVDADGDGFGDEEEDGVQQCEELTGYSREGGDCDDADAELNPNTSWYVDEDGDGYGDPRRLVGLGCEAPPDEAHVVVPNAGDCDDTNDEIHPLAADPIYDENGEYDGVDQNCDGWSLLAMEGVDEWGQATRNHQKYPVIDGCDPDHLILSYPTPGADLSAVVGGVEDCTVVVLGAGTWTLPNVAAVRKMAIVGAPGSLPEVVAQVGDPVALQIHEPLKNPAGVHVVVEGLSFVGFPTTFEVQGPVKLSTMGVVVSESELGVSAAPAEVNKEWGAPTVELWSTALVNGDVAVSQEGGALSLYNVAIDRMLSIDSVVYFRGSTHADLAQVSVRQVSVGHSAAGSGAILRVGAGLGSIGHPAEELVLRDTLFFGNVGPALLAPSLDSLVLDTFQVIDSGTVANHLIRVGGAAGGTAETLQGLLVHDNVWEPSILGGIVNDERALVMLDSLNTGGDPLLRASVLRGNEAPSDLPHLRLGGTPGQILNVEISAPAGVGIQAPSLQASHVTLVGLDTALVNDGGIGDFQVDDSIVAYNRRIHGLLEAVDTQGTTLWGNCVGVQEGSEPAFMRFHPNLPPSLWDLRLHGDPLGCKASGRTERGAFGKPSTGFSGLDGVYHDCDGNGFYDNWEAPFGEDPLVPGVDLDGDGLTNQEEYENGTLPDVADTDADGANDQDDTQPLDPTGNDWCAP